MRGEHLEDAVVQTQDGDVERAAAEVVDGDDAFFALVETIGERRGGRLVDEAEHFESRDAAGVLRGLALRVVEVGGNGDDGLRDLLAEVGFGVALEFAEHFGADLRRSHGAVAELQLDDGFAALGDAEREERQLVAYVFDAAAHQPLGGVDGAFGMRDQRVLRGAARRALAPSSANRDNTRDDALAIGTGNDLGMAGRDS